MYPQRSPAMRSGRPASRPADRDHHALNAVLADRYDTNEIRTIDQRHWMLTAAPVGREHPVGRNRISCRRAVR
jgi:hypothetical protein